MVHNTRPADLIPDVARTKTGCGPLDPTKMCLFWHTIAFVMLLGINMAMNAKILLLISKTISASAPDQGLCPWTPLGACPQTPIVAPLTLLLEIFLALSMK